MAYGEETQKEISTTRTDVPPKFTQDGFSANVRARTVKARVVFTAVSMRKKLKNDMANKTPRENHPTHAMATGKGCGLCKTCVKDVCCAGELPMPGYSGRTAEQMECLASLKRRYQKAGKFAEAKAIARAMKVLKCQ